MKNIWWIVLLLTFVMKLSLYAQENYSSYVNPFIGTGGHGHTFPGAVMPFGMVQLSPDTRIDGSWDGCGGYHYSDSLIYGFSHTHLSGTGVSDWGDILLMPCISNPSTDPKKYASRFSHQSEVAGAGFYEVKLDKDRIKAELTTTLRTGIHRYSYPVTGRAKLIVDLLHRDKTLDCNLKIIDSVTISGYRISEAWAREQHVYFVMKFSVPFKRIEYASGKSYKTSLDISNKEKANGAYFEFDLAAPKKLMVKLSISSVSEEGALKNMQSEATHWDFEKYKKSAQEAWNKELQKIEITESDKDKKTVFYTALYHCFIHPSLNMDVDNRYRGRDNQVHTAQGFTNYSVFSLWDTYRALNPLFTIVQPSRTADFINTFLTQYKEGGRLPIWELSGNETDCMIGFHSVSVIADAITKKINGFDSSLAYEAMKAASNDPRYGIPIFNKNGFLQVDDESESVSKTLEYGYDNWCIAQIARRLNNTPDETIPLKRAQAFRNLFDDSSAFMRPRKNGNWLNPFYPSEINNHFTEGNSWQYSFYVPHDLDALISLQGGKVKFEKKLDLLFNTTEKTRGRDQADVTGLVGQYAHGNEPSHHMAYLYNYVGKPQKTIARVQQICDDFYKNSPDGLIGNEDCGQMSAWYVFSTMGLYPVCPGSTEYVLSSPRFSDIKINPEGGNPFSILSHPLPGQSLSSVSVNGTSQLRSAISHENIAGGGSLEFIYSDNKASAKYGQESLAKKNTSSPIIAAPVIRSASQVFKEKLTLTLKPLVSGASQTRFTLDGSDPTRSSKLYNKAIIVDSNCIVKARTYAAGDSSTVTEAKFYKLKYKYAVAITATANPQYAEEGSQSLIDGINGTTNWRKGGWLGYQGQDFVCVVDLQKISPIKHISLDALQDTRSWIVFPKNVIFYGSSDGLKFELLGVTTPPVKADDYTERVFKFNLDLTFRTNLRYVKIVAHNFGTLPVWHQGSGGDAFIFVDEIEVE